VSEVNSKAASEVVGALMVITLITTTAGLLYVIASPVIAQSQESIKLRKAEFDMLELKEKLERVRFMVETNATYNLRLVGVSAEFKNEPILVIGGDTYSISSIRISGSGWSVYYESGAVIERLPSYGKMVSDPMIYYDASTDTLTMPVIMFTGNKSIGGTGTLTLHFSISNVERISGNTINLRSDNADVWCDYFIKIGLSPTCTPNTVTLSTSNTSIVLYEVNVR
jgi:hypothetical protein